MNLDLLLSIQQFKYFVPETTIAHLDEDTCIVYPGVSYPLSHVYGRSTPPAHIVKWNAPNFERVDNEVKLEKIVCMNMVNSLLVGIFDLLCSKSLEVPICWKASCYAATNTFQ